MAQSPADLVEHTAFREHVCLHHEVSSAVSWCSQDLCQPGFPCPLHTIITTGVFAHVLNIYLSMALGLEDLLLHRQTVVH